MANEKTRIFKGTYTSDDNKKHTVNVRIYKRFAALGLSLTLIVGSAGCVIATNYIKDTIKDDSFTDNDADLQTIEAIIKNDPYILKDVELGTRTIKVGDTLSNIAEDCGNTVKRICELNEMSSKNVIYPGQEIKIETITDKDPREKSIAGLESYFNDYLFNSSVAEIAKNALENQKNGGLFYRSILYGNPKSEYEYDPNSIYGEFINAYLRFHGIAEPTDAAKDEYIASLTDLSDKAVERLTFGDVSNILVPYSKYIIYLENRTTKYDEIQDIYRSIYS